MYACNECGTKSKKKHSHKGQNMSEVISGIYELKGENYLSPNQKSMNFWGAGVKKGGKN